MVWSAIGLLRFLEFRRGRSRHEKVRKIPGEQITTGLFLMLSKNPMVGSLWSDIYDNNCHKIASTPHILFLSRTEDFK